MGYQLFSFPGVPLEDSGRPSLRARPVGLGLRRLSAPLGRGSPGPARCAPLQSGLTRKPKPLSGFFMCKGTTHEITRKTKQADNSINHELHFPIYFSKSTSTPGIKNFDTARKSQFGIQIFGATKET